jgi:raffinose/stachyose/melibiose transport system substrate-binding protein
LCAATLVGCVTTSISGTPIASAATGIPNLSYKGTITMYASNYNPPITGVKVAPGTVVDPEMQVAANAFHKMYPGITIKFIPPTANSAGYSSGQWYISEAAAGTLPDVTWVPGYYVNVTLPTGLFQNLSPSFQQPNPFIAGNKKWISTMSSVALDLDVVPGNTPGTSGDFVVNGDWGGIGFYYNKNVFKAAGIAAPPTSWNQLQADSEQIDKKLGSKGDYAGASWTPVIYNWLAHYFQTNYLGLARAKAVWNIPANLRDAYQSYFYANDGDWVNPAKNPEITSWWPLGKALVSTWDPKNVDVPETTGPTSSTGVPLFLGGKIGYVLVSGYAVPKEVAALPKSQQFPVGYFELTSFKGTGKYATNLPVWQDNGGPETYFQFGISSHLADKSMTTAKFDAARAWLQFISTPTWDSNIVNEEGNAMPIIQGSTVPADLSSIHAALLANQKYYLGICLFDGLTAASFSEIDGLYLSYVGGYVPLKTAVSEYDTDAGQLVSQYNAKNSALVAKLTTYENKALGIK